MLTGVKELILIEFGNANRSQKLVLLVLLVDGAKGRFRI